MTETLYPIYYGTRLVTFDVLRNTFEPKMHPEAARRGFNFILHQGGKFGIGGGYRSVQPVRPGFAPPGKSFHQLQTFASGMAYYVAWDMVVVNPGHVHRSPTWSEVPAQGSQLAIEYGWHMNVSNEPWHAQPIEIDGYESWFIAGRPEPAHNYPIRFNMPRPQPPQPPVPENPRQTEGITVQFTSRVLVENCSGPDVKFFQRQLNELAGQGLLLDGYYGPKTVQAVKNWQGFFKKTADGKPIIVDGKLGPVTQQSIIEVALLAS